MMSLECKIAEIAFDVDFQYFQAFGSNTNNVINNVNSIVNAINGNQYEGQVGIVHEITEIVKADSDPETIRVVTSDKRLAEKVEGLGARVIPSGAFRHRMERFLA
jgi:hypothetical protein